MKHLLAKTIMGAYITAAAWAIGAGIRGPHAEGVGKDLAVGGSLLGVMAAIEWAAGVLKESNDSVL